MENWLNSKQINFMHQPYEQKLKHKADFRVRYSFYTEVEGGRKIIPYQGYRSDFSYEHKGEFEFGIFMIWPEFEDEDGNVILENDKSVIPQGTARMWIIDPKRRLYHKDKIHIGITGYFKEGSRSTAKCEVIEIIGLSENPTK
jgi:hypothetical protein